MSPAMQTVPQTDADFEEAVERLADKIGQYVGEFIEIHPEYGALPKRPIPAGVSRDKVRWQCHLHVARRLLSST